MRYTCIAEEVIISRKRVPKIKKIPHQATKKTKKITTLAMRNEIESKAILYSKNLCEYCKQLFFKDDLKNVS